LQLLQGVQGAYLLAGFRLYCAPSEGPSLVVYAGFQPTPAR
jgi:hypothetical protein